MNTANNARRRASQRRIEGAFVELLQGLDLNQIRVTDICKMANVNRTTFYANYLDIYDLAEKVQEKLAADVGAFFGNAEASTNNRFLALFQHVQENQLFYKTYFKLGGDTRFQATDEDIRMAIGHYNLSETEHLRYRIEFFRNGFNAILKLWLEDGCKESPEVMHSILMAEYAHHALVQNMPPA